MVLKIYHITSSQSRAVAAAGVEAYTRSWSALCGP